MTEKSAQCADILKEARARNRDLQLTGYLHLEDGAFYQWLEGPAGPLEDVAQMILRDPRHDNVEFLWRGHQDARQFGAWWMGFGTSRAGRLFDWVADQGVQVGDPRSFSTGLLDFMRNSLAARPG